MSDCPRILAREQIIAGLKAGRALNVDRCDAPELRDLMEMEADGLVTSRLIVLGEQSSVLQFRWSQP